MFVVFFSGSWVLFFFFHHPPCNPAEIGFIKILLCVQHYQNLRVQDTFNMSTDLSPPFSFIQLKT